jgi:hypothetical protein
MNPLMAHPCVGKPDYIRGFSHTLDPKANSKIHVPSNPIVPTDFDRLIDF